MINIAAAGFESAAALWLLVSASGKITNHPAARRAFGQYSLIPTTIAGVLVYAVSAIELLLGVGLALITGVDVVPIGTVVLLLTFSAAQAWDLRNNHVHECGCAGTNAVISWRRVGLTAALATALALSLVMDGPPEASLKVSLLLLYCCAGLVLSQGSRLRELAQTISRIVEPERTRA